MVGLTYSYDWGFIPSTQAEDGDPLDVIIIHVSQIYPGVVLRCRPIGILENLQKRKGKEEHNDRIFAVPERSPLESNLEDIRDLPSLSMNSKVLPCDERARRHPWGGAARSRHKGHQAAINCDGWLERSPK
jgi:inorganic pyrophosphatase